MTSWDTSTCLVVWALILMMFALLKWITVNNFSSWQSFLSKKPFFRSPSHDSKEDGRLRKPKESSSIQPTHDSCETDLPGRAQGKNYSKARNERKQDFLKHAGSDYGYASSSLGHIDGWRPQEIPGLIHPLSPIGNKIKEDGDSTNSIKTGEQPEKEVYLDYAGAALPHSQQLHEILHANRQQILANPHSTGPAASRTMLAVEQIKKNLLDFWNGHPGKHYFSGAGTTHSTATERPHSVPDEDLHPGYEIIFTSGSTQALRMVAESFPWKPVHRVSRASSSSSASAGSTLVYPINCHTSILGMREPALARGAQFQCWTMSEITKAIHSGQLDTQVLSKMNDDLEDEGSRSGTTKHHHHRRQYHCLNKDDSSNGPNLLVLPAECNFSGAKVPVETLLRSLEVGSRRQSRKPKTWWTLVDLAKVTCTSSIHLRQMNPDFACISFYKLFGEPTGLGCLLVKRTALGQLRQQQKQKQQQHPPPLRHLKCDIMDHRAYFGGGSVRVVLPQQDYVVPRGSSNDDDDDDDENVGAGLTHGTIHFRGIVALQAGLNMLQRMGGMGAIQRHTTVLYLELVKRLKAVAHTNGSKAIEIYNFQSASDSSGPTVSFNVLRSDGSYVGYNEVSKLAALNRPPIQLRTGCFCNPGGCQLALCKTDDEVLYNYTKAGHVCGDGIDVIDGKPTGAVRVSLGKDSIWEDIDAVVTFLEKAFVSQTIVGAADREEAWDGRPRQVVLSELYIYPIKSCRAQRVTKWKLEKGTRRPIFDREFALVDSFGLAMRLQRYPKMAFICPEVDTHAEIMTISAPGKEPLTLLLESENPACGQGTINVCGNKCGSVLWGDHQVSHWFSDYLGVQCWLARHLPGNNNCQLTTNNTTDSISFNRSSVAFANEQPLLLISEHAVDALNQTLSLQGQPPVTSRHFRPNLVVRLAGQNTTAPKIRAEDGWTVLRGLGAKHRVGFDVVGQCARCSMVDVDPSSGIKEGNALRALADYRRNNGQITFGIFLKSSSSSSSTPTGLPENDSSEDKDQEDEFLEEGDIFWCE